MDEKTTNQIKGYGLSKSNRETQQGKIKQRSVGTHQQASPVYSPPDFSIRALTGNPHLDWPIRLPAEDPQGWLTGANHKPWKKASDGKTGISGNWYGLKSGKVQPCHSLLEAKLRAYFDMCPFVLDCRTQYPQWNREKFERYYRSGKPFPKNGVMTIDFMLTLAIPGVPYLLYHGVSGKPHAFLDEPKTISRHIREWKALASWGSTHEVMTELSIPRIEYSNYLLLKSWLLWTDIEANITPALSLVEAICSSKIEGTLDRLLSMIGKRQGHCIHTSYRLFAIAVFLGYLRVNHRFKLRPNLPLVRLA